MTNRNSLAAGVLAAGAPPLGFRVGSTGADRAGELRHAGTAETRAELLPRGAEVRKKLKVGNDARALVVSVLTMSVEDVTRT